MEILNKNCADEKEEPDAYCQTSMVKFSEVSFAGGGNGELNLEIYFLPS